MYLHMKKRSSNSPFALSIMISQLAATSWETIVRRTLMMAQGTCSPAEYQRMSSEKVEAAKRAMTALSMGKGQAAVLAPFVSRTRANVARLRRGK
jgi:hypothetical protein